MQVKRWVGLALLLCAAISIVWGSVIGLTHHTTTDFRAVYYGTRCLLQHHNPYNVAELESVLTAEHGDRPFDDAQQHEAITLYVNLPSTFIFVAPFAILPYGLAQALWLGLLAGLLVIVGLLIWDLSRHFAPGASLFLICLVLTNSMVIFSGGNTAGIAVPSCLIAVWCFLQRRFVPLGIVCMALSLAIKPHDSGLVWLYFILAGGVYRKHAWQSLIGTIGIFLAGVTWVSLVAPHWIRDWRANMNTIANHGHINDPGPHSVVGFHSLGSVIDLQSVLSVFNDDPRFYNSTTYLVCGSLLAAWLCSTLLHPISKQRTFLALATIAPLTLLITYHRPWDAKLLLLTVPACSMLWAESGLTGWLAVSVNTAGLVFTGDIPMATLGILTRNLHISTVSLSGKILTVLIERPIPLILLLMGVFYSVIYVRHSRPGDAQRSGPL